MTTGNNYLEKKKHWYASNNSGKKNLYNSLICLSGQTCSLPFLFKSFEVLLRAGTRKTWSDPLPLAVLEHFSRVEWLNLVGN